MTGRKKPFKAELVARTETTGGIVGTRPEDVTPEQYEKGWESFAAGSTLMQALSATGMVEKQFRYLVNNPLPGHEDKCPSYNQRFAEQLAAVRYRAIEAIDEVSKGAVNGLKRMDDISRTAGGVVQMILRGMVQELVENAERGSSAKKPMAKLMPSKPVLDTLKVLKDYADYSKVGAAFKTVFGVPFEQGGVSPGGGSGRGNHGPQVDLSADMALPAHISTMADTQQHHKQSDEEQMLQKLFRRMDQWSESDLDKFLDTGDFPEPEYHVNQLEADYMGEDEE